MMPEFWADDVISMEFLGSNRRRFSRGTEERPDVGGCIRRLRNHLKSFLEGFISHSVRSYLGLQQSFDDLKISFIVTLSAL